VFDVIQWQDDAVVLIDQRKLPTSEEYVVCRDLAAVADAIRDMVVRGAPAIGVTAAMGMAVVAQHSGAASTKDMLQELDAAAEVLVGTRPTAVNLAWAVRRMRSLAHEHADRTPAEMRDTMVEAAKQMHAEDIAINRAIGRNGAELLDDGDTVLTHCNAGALATAGYGTALGVVRAAYEAGKRVQVLADETRPFLQGARLTAWELQRDGIPVTVITDNMAGQELRLGNVRAVVVGADRIAANGDTANKIGTYPLAVVARENDIPFYVAAPTSTIDRDLPDGASIPIEERPALEVTTIGGLRIVPDGVPVKNPAFDVTPARYVTAIITERGVHRPPYEESLPAK